MFPVFVLCCVAAARVMMMMSTIFFSKIKLVSQSSIYLSQFHIRVYCVASGDISVYIYTRMLALFSWKPFALPVSAETIDLAPHLTNSSLQTHRLGGGEEEEDEEEKGAVVRLLDELIGCHILSHGASAPDVSDPDSTLTSDHLANIQDQIADTLAETFAAALQSPIHFQVRCIFFPWKRMDRCAYLKSPQPLPNAFELYGVDFLVEHVASPQPQFSVKLLEINAEPAIELTGPRLTWALEDLFDAIARVCVDPFVRDVPVETWPVGQTRHHLRKCLQTTVRGF